MSNLPGLLDTHSLTDFALLALWKMLLASICGGLIGVEREMKGRPAGLKTFSLVCLGSTLIMVTNDYIYTYISQGTGDAARMAAQVISGIGFLGAGSIIVTGHSQVKGLTTAAALWVTAAIGICIGTGFYFGGIAGLCVLYVTSFVYRWLDQKIMERSRIMKIYVEGQDEEFMLKLVRYLYTHRFKVLSLSRKPENKWYASDTCAMIELDLRRRTQHELILEDVRALDGFRYIEEID